MNREEFIEKIVKIDLMEDSDDYGHYPFQLYVVKDDDSTIMNALALGGDVAACYRNFRDYFNEGAKQIFMSLDFPPNKDIEKDFVAIFSFDNGELNVIAMPYEITTGDKLPIVESGELLDIVMSDLKSFLKIV